MLKIWSESLDAYNYVVDLIVNSNGCGNSKIDKEIKYVS